MLVHQPSSFHQKVLHLGGVNAGVFRTLGNLRLNELEGLLWLPLIEFQFSQASDCLGGIRSVLHSLSVEVLRGLPYAKLGDLWTAQKHWSLPAINAKARPVFGRFSRF